MKGVLARYPGEYAEHPPHTVQRMRVRSRKATKWPLGSFIVALRGLLRSVDSLVLSVKGPYGLAIGETPMETSPVVPAFLQRFTLPRRLLVILKVEHLPVWQRIGIIRTFRVKVELAFAAVSGV